MGYTRGVNRGGIQKHPLYNTFNLMIARCYAEKRWNYQFYGARGIKVCQRWLGEKGFLNFIQDMGDRPNGFQLDRIDVNNDYSPENCRWVDKYTQMGNVRNNNPVPGVGWHKQRKKFRARLKIKGKEKSLGLFNSFEEAVEARLLAYKTLCL